MTTRVLSLLIVAAIAALFVSPFVIDAVGADTSANGPPPPDSFKAATDFYDSAWNKLIFAVTLIVAILTMSQWQHTRSFRDAKKELTTKIEDMRKNAAADLRKVVSNMKDDLRKEIKRVEKEAVDSFTEHSDTINKHLSEKTADSLIGQAALAMNTPTVPPGYTLALLAQGLAAWGLADRDIDKLAPILRLTITYLRQRHCFIALRESPFTSMLTDVLNEYAQAATSNGAKTTIVELRRLVEEAATCGENETDAPDVPDEN